MIESTRMLIEWLGRRHDIPEAGHAAALMKTGIDAALADPSTRTPDIRGTGRQQDMINGILKGMESFSHASA